jgi:hypothetical protein
VKTVARTLLYGALRRVEPRTACFEDFKEALAEMIGIAHRVNFMNKFRKLDLSYNAPQ